MIQELRERAKALQQEDKEKYELISNILSDDNCFLKMDIETAYSILKDLGIEDIEKTYIKLMKRK